LKSVQRKVRENDKLVVFPDLTYVENFVNDWLCHWGSAYGDIWQKMKYACSENWPNVQ